MSGPQKEDGHVRIANEIIEAFAQYKLSSEEWKVLFVVLRKTYGWNKKTDKISLSQFCSLTKMNRSSVHRALKKLIEKNMVTKEIPPSYSVVTKSSYSQVTREVIEYAFNKDFTTWKIFNKSDKGGYFQVTTGYSQVTGVVTKQTQTGYSQVNETGYSQVTHKRQKTLTKDTNTKDIDVSVENKIPELPLQVTQIKKSKKKYGEYQKVLLTDEEHAKLQEKFGSSIGHWIKALDEGIEMKGYKYANHYLVILKWSKNENNKQGENNNANGKTSGSNQTFTGYTGNHGKYSHLVHK